MSYDPLLVSKQITDCLASGPRSTLAGICRELRIDRRTARGAIHTAYGKSFREFQTGLILKRAASLLVRPELSIKQVAHGLGYNSPRAFAQFVKKSTGQSPTAWRALLAHRRRPGDFA